MITADRVTAKGFKGQEFDQALGGKTLIVGPNGAGKSSRVLALILAIQGFIPGVAKKNPDIMAAFGSNGELAVGFEVGGTHLERVWCAMKDGSVKQSYKVNGNRAQKDFYNQTMGGVGALVPFDVSAFMDLSNAAQINELFRIYPPAGEARKLLKDIDESKERINSLEKRERDTQAAQAVLSTSLAEIKLPGGNLAELKGLIKDAEESLALAQQEKTEFELLQRQEEEAKKEAPQQAEGPADELFVEEIKQEAKGGGLPPAPAGFPVAGRAQNGGSMATGPIKGAALISDPIASIKTIIEAIDAAGCTVCAARLVAIRELNKFSKGGV